MRVYWFLLLFVSLTACTIEASQGTSGASIAPKALEWDAPIDPDGRIIETRFPAPEGFVRMPLKQGSFGHYLRRRWLKAHGSPVMLHDGRIKQAQVHAAVIDLDMGKRDLQQCADAIIRLRAEHYYEKRQFDSIAFHFTNGFYCDYRRWVNGDRIRLYDNQTWWIKRADTLESYLNFRKYLDIVFAFAGTWSLAQELDQVAYEELAIGDVMIHGGMPGHAAIVVDVVVDPGNGNKLYLLAQSYMPAQEVHILKNPNAPYLSPWYQLDPSAQQIRTPEWTFYPHELRRFMGANRP
jgi:hypothetical protein